MASCKEYDFTTLHLRSRLSYGEIRFVRDEEKDVYAKVVQSIRSVPQSKSSDRDCTARKPAFPILLVDGIRVIVRAADPT